MTLACRLFCINHTTVSLSQGKGGSLYEAAARAVLVVLRVFSQRKRLLVLLCALLIVVTLPFLPSAAEGKCQLVPQKDNEACSR